MSYRVITHIRMAPRLGRTGEGKYWVGTSLASLALFVFSIIVVCDHYWESPGQYLDGRHFLFDPMMVRAHSNVLFCNTFPLSLLVASIHSAIHLSPIKERETWRFRLEPIGLRKVDETRLSTE